MRSTLSRMLRLGIADASPEDICDILETLARDNARLRHRERLIHRTLARRNRTARKETARVR